MRQLFKNSHCYAHMTQKVHSSLLFLALLFVNATNAQVSVYGFYSTYTDPSNPIVLGQYEAISGEWLEWDTLAFCDGVVMGSSAFDAGTESYMFAGIGAAPGNNSIQFWDYDVIDNAIVNNPSFNQTINAIQHDMAGDRLLALGTYAQDSTFIDFGNGTGYWEYEWGSELIELNPEESSVTSIAPIEGINGVVLGATAFDSDNDIYALVGMDYAGNQKFIQLDGTTGAVISSVNLQIPSNMGFNELECFINGETFLGIKRPYGINPNAETTALVSVNPSQVSSPTWWSFLRFTRSPPMPVCLSKRQASSSCSITTSTTRATSWSWTPLKRKSLPTTRSTVPSSSCRSTTENSWWLPMGMRVPFMARLLKELGNCGPIPQTPWCACKPNAAPYQVYDAAGKLVQPWSSALEIDVRDWLAGTYIAIQANGRTARFNVAH